MAFKVSQLSLMSYGAGNSLFSYRTEDATAEVLAPGYFNTNQIRTDDIVLVLANASAERQFFGLWITGMTESGALVGEVMRGPDGLKNAAPEPRREDGREPIADLRARAKAKGINTFGKSRAAIEAELAAA